MRYTCRKNCWGKVTDVAQMLFYEVVLISPLVSHVPLACCPTLTLQWGTNLQISANLITIAQYLQLVWVCLGSGGGCKGGFYPLLKSSTSESRLDDSGAVWEWKVRAPLSLETLSFQNERETVVSSLVTKVCWALPGCERAIYQVGSSGLRVYIKKHQEVQGYWLCWKVAVVLQSGVPALGRWRQDD